VGDNKAVALKAFGSFHAGNITVGSDEKIDVITVRKRRGENHADVSSSRNISIFRSERKDA